jgi:hypothetical protein
MRENPEKTNYWRQQIQVLQESELTRRAYCEKNQVKLSTLSNWLFFLLSDIFMFLCAYKI